jgi:hypothetical protein
MKYLMIFLLVALLSGCHPGTWTVGHVTDLKGQPIKGASVKLYSSEQNTNSEGCFTFEGADALPFTLSASATGFKDVVVPSKAGHFIIEIKMAPINSNSSSEVVWKKIATDDYRKTKKCN